MWVNNEASNNNMYSEKTHKKIKNKMKESKRKEVG
jgi:hypothetical protein